MAQKNIEPGIAKEVSIAHTPSGLAPSMVSWDLTESQICKKTKEIIVPILQMNENEVEVYIETEDVFENTPEHIKKRHLELNLFVWIPSKSKHLVASHDQSMAVLGNKTITRFSPELKEMLDKFGMKNQQKAWKDKNNSNRTGFLLDFRKIASLLFDQPGTFARNELGEGRKTSLDIIPNISKENGKLISITFQKSADTGFRSRPQAKKSFRA